MRIAALYDIHGNLPALEAVLEDVQRERVDEIIIGGDVFPGPMAVESLDLLLSLDTPTRFIRGNGDREVLAIANGEQGGGLPEDVRESIQWVAQQLTPEMKNIMETWQATLNADIDELGDVHFCHATPNSDTAIFTRRTPEARLIPVFAHVAGSLVVCGHTHMQFDRMVRRTRVINAGSVGMPFGESAAGWLLLGPDIQLRRTPYDLAAAAARLRATDYPHVEDLVQRYVLQSPSEQEMLELYEDVELR